MFLKDQSFRFFALLFFSFLIYSCDNPAGNDDDGHHHRANGFVLYADDEEIVRQQFDQEESTLLFNEDSPYADGESIVIEEGDSVSVSIHFLDDSHLFQPEENDYSLAWEISGDTNLAIVQDTAGGWDFRFEGLDEGSAGVTFQMMHGSGDHSHPDFTSVEVPVTIIAPAVVESVQ